MALDIKNNPVRRKEKSNLHVLISPSAVPRNRGTVEKWNPLKGIYKERKGRRGDREGRKLKRYHMERYTIAQSFPRKDIYVHIFFQRIPPSLLPSLPAGGQD